MGDIDSTLNVSIFDDNSLKTVVVDTNGSLVNTPRNPLGTAMFDTASHRGYLQITDGTNSTTINNLGKTAIGLDTVPLGLSIGSWYPNGSGTTFHPDLADGEVFPLQLDASGTLQTRGAVLTDEGGFYDSFPGGALRADWTVVQTGAGTSYSVSNSQLVINSGTTANAEIIIYIPIDYPPFKFYCDAKVSQRIANQDVYIGLVDTPDSASETQYARFHFNGTDNTKITCETQSHAGAGTQQAYTATIADTSISKDWVITLSQEQVSFLSSPDTPVNMQLLTTFTDEIPGMYTPLYLRLKIKNGAIAPVSNTALTLDLVKFTNYDRIEIGNTTEGDPIATELMAYDGTVSRVVKCDTTGRLLVSQAFAAQTINLSYNASSQPLVANMWMNVLKYTIPTGYNFEIIEFNSEAANANAFFRFTSALSMGTYNLTGLVFTDGSAYSTPGFATFVEAEVTTIFTGTAVTFTVTYINESGVAGRTGTITTTAAPTVGQRFALVLQAGDLGVKDITAVTKAGGTAGICTFYGLTELLYEHHSITNESYPRLTARQSIILLPGQQLQFDITHTTTTSLLRIMKAVGLLTATA